MSRRLITTADDFGDTPAVNAAVVRAHRDGVLRFASLMVKRPGAEAAARLAGQNPGLGVGLHLELCADNPEAAGLRYAFDAAAKRGLEGEIRGQLDRLKALGIARPTHVDGHMHVHAHPVVFPLLCRLAREYGIPRVRLPSGEWDAAKGFAPTLRGAWLALVFGSMTAWVKASAAGLELPGTWGYVRSGLMSEEYLLHLLGRLPEGTTEIYFHPSADPALRPADGRPTASHQNVLELETLLSPRVKAALEAAGIELVSAAR